MSPVTRSPETRTTGWWTSQPLRRAPYGEGARRAVRRRRAPLAFAAAALALAGVAVAFTGAARLGVADEPTKVSEEDGARHFVEIARVLQSPRCRNCHPSGDAPLHGDTASPHSMNVSRVSVASGLGCTTCHRSENQEAEHAPPGVPGWRMPPADTPMVFEGLTPAELCARLKDPKKNGGRSPEALRDHMDHDALVLWAWSPGAGRTVPPLTHDALMTHVKRWVEAGAPCPK